MRWLPRSLFGQILLALLAVAGVFVSCSRGGALALATSGSVITLVLYRAGILRGARVGAAEWALARILP